MLPEYLKELYSNQPLEAGIVRHTSLLLLSTRDLFDLGNSVLEQPHMHTAHSPEVRDQKQKYFRLQSGDK